MHKQILFSPPKKQVVRVKPRRCYLCGCKTRKRRKTVRIGIAYRMLCPDCYSSIK